MKNYIKIIAIISGIIIIIAGVFYIKNNKKENPIVVSEQRTKQQGEGKVNRPILLPGMKAISFEEGKEKPIILQENEQKEGIWYNYEVQTTDTSQFGTSKWANAMTQDGSMWVWIPRYAYKIDWNGQDEAGKIDVIFLSGNTDFGMNDEDVTKLGYKVHPAFKNGKTNDFSNGEWDKEITGLWVAKFEAGYAGQKNTSSENVKPINTNLQYNRMGENVYGEIIEDTYYKYPVFMGKCFSYNNLQIGEMYELSLELSKENNPYGLNSTVDSHMMKNSEWGAVAYLAHSKYGRNGGKISINNIDVSKAVNLACTVTGYAGNTVDEVKNQILKIDSKLKDSYENKSFAWYTKKGMLGSTTGNLYGIFDMNGASSEYMAGYINSIKQEDKNIYFNIENNNKSTKYCTIFKSEAKSEGYNSNNNYLENKHIIGDATIETSKRGSGYNSWFDGSSSYIKSDAAFFLRGGEYNMVSYSGILSYTNHSGHSLESYGFRTVLIEK